MNLDLTCVQIKAEVVRFCRQRMISFLPEFATANPPSSTATELASGDRTRGLPAPTTNPPSGACVHCYHSKTKRRCIVEFRNRYLSQSQSMMVSVNHASQFLLCLKKYHPLRGKTRLVRRPADRVEHVFFFGNNAFNRQTHINDGRAAKFTAFNDAARYDSTVEGMKTALIVDEPSDRSAVQHDAVIP